MFDYRSPKVTYFPQPEVADIVQEVQRHHKGWCIFQGIYWSCQLAKSSHPNI